MAGNPRIVLSDINVPWDGGMTFVRKGSIVDIPAGSSLETAYGGPSNLAPLGGDPGALGGDPGDSEPVDEEGGVG
jgi:hypothetical protein